MSKRGKQYRAVLEKVDTEKVYSPDDAIGIAKDACFAKFDETIEVHFSLGIDPRHADQQIRGTINYPNGTGKSVRLAVVAQGDKADDAVKEGADEVGADDLIEKIKGGWFDFDILIASPDMMAKLGKLGKELGTKGLMPSPKSGTVTPEIGKAVKEFKAGKIEYRNDKDGNIHTIIGKKSFEPKALMENFEMIYDVLQKAKPSKAQGTYFKSITISSTMGPGIKVEPLKVKWKEVA